MPTPDPIKTTELLETVPLPHDSDDIPPKDPSTKQEKEEGIPVFKGEEETSIPEPPKESIPTEDPAPAQTTSPPAVLLPSTTQSDSEDYPSYVDGTEEAPTAQPPPSTTTSATFITTTPSPIANQEPHHTPSTTQPTDDFDHATTEHQEKDEDENPKKDQNEQDSKHPTFPPPFDIPPVETGDSGEDHWDTAPIETGDSGEDDGDTRSVGTGGDSEYYDDYDGWKDNADETPLFGKKNETSFYDDRCIYISTLLLWSQDYDFENITQEEIRDKVTKALDET